MTYRPHPATFGRLIPAIALIAATPMLVTVASPSIAAEPAAGDAVDSGTLLLRGPGVATALPAVRLGTDMNVTVSGSIARVRVTQAFRNTSDRWMEATYLYPLPDDGAVDTLKMVVGQRVIVGHVERREQARATYDAAKRSGRKAGLVEQQRANMFTNRVANVGPGETVVIAIEYQAPVRQTSGTYALRLPLVVAPRYVPARALGSAAGAADAAAITASPILDPKLGPINPVTITVQLDPGFAPANVISRYHRVSIAGTGERRTIRVVGQVPADRDFELDWRSAAADPTVGLFRTRVAGQEYLMATVVPPADTAALVVPPREMVFVIDNSGSMGGSSMDEAKASLVHALTTLRPGDSFNVIRFDDTMTQLFPKSVPATADRIAAATRYAQGLEAAGGTEMLPALKAALADAAATGNAATVRQIVFLTDGAISDEAEMLATLERDGGRSHVFLVGIGSAPNTFLMSRMASIGRGTYTNIGSTDEVAARMSALLEILRRPAVQNLTVAVDGTPIDLTPRQLPDLYVGEPLVLLGHAADLRGRITVSGQIGARRWTRTLDLAAALPSAAVDKLWARRRVDEVETERTLGTMAGDAADEAIALLGLEHAIVTSQTSLVAVDDTRSRPEGVLLTREDLPLALPAGWDFETLLGGASAKAALANANTMASRAAEQAFAATALDLPQTATGFVATIVGGLGAMLAGLLGLALLRRRRGRA